MHRIILLLLALTATALSGCTSNAEPDSDELLGAEGDLGADQGVLHAMVYADWGAPIQGATVSLLGTIFSGTTGEVGMAEFPNVPSGTYTLRIEMNKFLPAERQVTVVAQATAHEEFVLFLKDDSPDARTHLHDYWSGETEILLVDDHIRAEPEYRTDMFAWWPLADMGYTMPLNGLHRMNNVQAGEDPDYLFRIPVQERTPDDRRPALVYPGASKVVITVDWSDAQLTQAHNMGVAYLPPGADVSEVILLDGKESGGVWEVPVEPEQADQGHQSFSHWNFFVYNANAIGEDGYQPQFSFDEAFRVTATVVKGDEVPYEPPHRDFWADGPEKKILIEDVQEIDQFTVRDWRNPNSGHLFLEDEQMIPPGTEKVVIQYTYTHGEKNNNDGELTPTGNTPQTLTIRTADQNPFETPVSEYRKLTGGPCEDAPAWGTCVRYEFDLEKGWADSFYQTKSLWRFLSNPEGGEDERRYNTGGSSTLTMELDITLYGPTQ